MELVCLDTHILIWGIKEEAEPGQEDMIPKAKSFLKWLEDNKAKVFVPAVVVAELLMRVPPEEHGRMLDFFRRNFITPPFDTVAASCFAKIWQKKASNDIIKKLKKDLSITREKMKIDFQIVAIAVTRRASCIYSYDPGMLKFAEGFIPVEKIPDEALAKQLSIKGIKG